MKQISLQILATEIYKVRIDLGPDIMKDIFHFVEKPHNLRNDSILQNQRNRTMFFGTESISFLPHLIWETILSEIKNAKSQGILKENTEVVAFFVLFSISKFTHHYLQKIK